ncbi:MAG: DUF58 domain-containing protein [Thermomicrobiales bacterium]
MVMRSRRRRDSAQKQLLDAGASDAGLAAIQPFDERTIRQLQRLTFASGDPTSHGLSGEHRSRRRGQSPEFTDYKSYTHGDDFRRIDWNSYARLDQLFIRESEVPTEHDVHLFIDDSTSMNWSSDRAIPTKFQAAQRIVSMLGYVAIWHFDRLSIQRLAADPRGEFGPVQGRSNTLGMFRFCNLMTPNAGERTVSQAESIARYLQRRKRPGRLILVSDFHWAEMETLRELMIRAATRRWQTTLILVEDPDEVDPSGMFADSSHLELEAIADRDRMHVSGSRVSVGTYLDARTTWREQLEQLANLPGVTFTALRTNDPNPMKPMSNLIDVDVIRR